MDYLNLLPFSGRYERNVDDDDLSEWDEPNESFYGPKVPRTKTNLKRHGMVLDTNFLAWMHSMKEWNGSDWS